MNIKEMLTSYYQRSVFTKTPGQCKFERGNIEGLLKCLSDLNISDTDDLTEETWFDIIDWYQNILKIQNSTIKKRLSFLRTVMKSFRIQSVFFQLNYPKDDKMPFQRFQDDEVITILKTLKSMEEKRPHDENLKMYIMIVYLLLDTGIRISELFDIKVYNVNLTNRFIFLEHTKNNKKEPVLFSDFSYEKIEYIYNQKYDKEFLLWNPRLNRQLNFNTDLRKFFLRLSEKTGIRIHAHRFRKTFGTMMYTESRDWRFTQKALRHSDIRTTQIYVSESLEFVRSEYIKASKGFDKFKV